MSTVTKEMDVAERNRQANERRMAEIRSNLERMDLVEFLPAFAEQLWKFADEHIICDPRGSAITCHSRWSRHIVESFNGLLGREIESLELRAGGKSVFVFTATLPLTIPERHTLDTMNTYFESNYPGFCCEDDWVYFPEAMKPYIAPANYEDERDAFEAAEVLTAITNMESRVVATDEGFAVALHDTDGDLTDCDALYVIGAVHVLEKFHCVRKLKEQFRIDDNDSDSTPWQRSVAERFTQQQRIEDGINAILAHLGHPGGVTPSAADKTPPAAPVAAQKGKSAGKSTPKQTA